MWPIGGRITTSPDVLERFAVSLGRGDRVAFEVTGGAWETARILEPHVRRVVVVSPDDTGIRQARAKTDRLDARTLAKLLAASELDAVWMPDERCRVLRRRLARREQSLRSRSRSKNEIHAVLMRRLKGRPPVSDLFGVKGRKWLRELELPVEEGESVASALRHIEAPAVDHSPQIDAAGADLRPCETTRDRSKPEIRHKPRPSP